MAAEGADGGPDRRAAAEAERFLGRRPRTEREMRSHLEAAGYAATEVEGVVTALRAAGHLDDRSLAAHFLLTRAERLGRGRGRLLRELEARGVDAEVARAAWDRLVADGSLDPRAMLTRALARRLRGSRGPLDRRAAARVYNALLREGFDPEQIRAALARFSGDTARLDEDLADEAHDDLP